MSASNAALQRDMHTLYHNHHGWLLGWMRTRLECADQAADLAHDTFVRLLAAPDAGGKVGAIREPRSYLATVGHRVLVDWIRRRSIERAYLEALAMQPEPLAPSPETRETIIETLMRIDAMLDGLAPRTRRIFLMARIDGLSFVEIGRRLDLSVTSVRKHFIRAMTNCLQLIED